MIKGFVTGSFRPFHKGHEALIDYAKSNCDELTICITTLPDEVIPYKYRLKWVLSTYLDDPKVQIVADTVQEPALRGDALSGWWGMYVTQKFGKFDRVFTSEDYGDVFAKAMGAEHWKFDQGRNIVPVSATIIRNKPFKYWDYINSFAKDYFVKKIAIVGTESTGKTTMCKKLAEKYNTVWVPEVGRELIPDSSKCSIEDLKLVASEHAKSIIRHTRLANKLLFIDTDLSITKSYSEFLFGEVPKVEPWVEKANDIDFYIYLSSDAPYFDDGTRMEKKRRDELDKSHHKLLDKKFIHEFRWDGGGYNEFTQEQKYEERLKRVVYQLNQFIYKFQ
jgi:HTH-type transcriptional regulator, transcriptional repressor of NAD biosynthesis genes